MDKKTGAPPDDYAEMGQNWGFPTYNWERMKQDGYKWWQVKKNHKSRGTWNRPRTCSPCRTHTH